MNICQGHRHHSSLPNTFNMARLGRLGFLGVAIVFHVIYGLSIFDVYFRSPIVSGMRAYSVDSPRAPAQRLVLYVGRDAAPSDDRRESRNVG